MTVKGKLKEFDERLKELENLKKEINHLNRNIDALTEYLTSDTLKREPKERPRDFPVNKDSGKRAGKRITKKNEMSKIKAKLIKLGCKLIEKKTTTQIKFKGKKIAVLKNSGRLERKVIVDGVSGWKKTTLKKLIKIIGKKK